VVLGVTVATQRGFADECFYGAVPSENSLFRIGAEYDKEKESWFYKIVEKKTGVSRSGKLDRIEAHAHLEMYISKSGDRFAVLNLVAGHRFEDRIMIYDSHGRLLKSLGVSDILADDEFNAIGHSFTHLFWLKMRPNTEYLPEKHAVRLFLITGRTVVVSLIDGSLSDEKKTGNQKKTGNPSIDNQGDKTDDAKAGNRRDARYMRDAGMGGGDGGNELGTR
jgi:hypothetical protein